MAIDVDFTDIDEEFIPALNAIIDEFTDLTGIFETIVDDVLIPENQEIFSSDGRGLWDDTSRPNPILRDTLRLYGSLTDRNHPDNITEISQYELEFGSDVFYHDYHEEGTSRFVARPVIGYWDIDDEVDAEFQEWITDVIDRHILRVV